MFCLSFEIFLVLKLGLMYVNTLAVPRNGIGFHNSGFDNLEFNDIYLIKEYHNTTRTIRCSLLCAETVTCMSFFVLKQERKCRLHGLALFNQSNGVGSEGWRHYVYGENCPVNLGFIHDRENNLCVKNSETKLKADEGKQFCMNFSSSLISLESDEKLTRFYNLLAKIPESLIFQRVRIGLVNTDKEWKWLSGSPLKKGRWYPGEPNCENCDCGGVSVDMDEFWYDNDDPCKDMRWQSFCEAQYI